MEYIKKYLHKCFDLTAILGKFAHSFFALFGIICTIYFAWKNIGLADLTRLQNYEIGKENILLTTNKMRSEEFQKNLKNLSSDSLLIRVGAISILENIARNYPLEYYWPTVHVLLSYVKLNCDKHIVTKGCQGNDVQEIISFLSEGEYDVPHKMSDRIDLANVMLNNIDFGAGKFRFANFPGVIFDNINFSGATLADANFEGSIIYHSQFSNSDLHHANFSNSKLKNVDFFHSNLQYVRFSGVIFDFKKDLIFTKFMDSDLRHASFCTGYDLKNNQLTYECATGLVCNSLKSVKLYDTVELPPYLSSCKYRIIPDPVHLEVREAINDYDTSGNPQKLYDALATSSLEGRLIYHYRSSH